MNNHTARRLFTLFATAALLSSPLDAGASGGDFIANLIDHSAGMTVAVDSNGAVHIAAAAMVEGNYRVVYGRCAGQCGGAKSWRFVALPAESSTSYVPTIALTANGRPRILYTSDMGPAPGSHYLQCDGACDEVASWHDVQLTRGDPGANPVPRPRVPFAVSPGGAAAFAYDDTGNGMYVWYCSSSCALETSWTRVQLGGTYVYPESAAFSSDRSLQVVARHGIRDDESLLWLDCSGDCASPASWANIDGLAQTHGQQHAAIARTGQGGTRIVLYGDAPGTAAVEKVFGYLSCDSACRTPTSWKVPMLVPIPPGAGDVGFDLALNGRGEPFIGVLGDLGSGYATCAGDCTSPAGQWRMVAGVSASGLNAGLPPIVPAGCLSASWGMYVGPSLALDSHGTPVVALTAHAKGVGGQCSDKDSPATMTESFLYSGSP